MSDFTTDLQLRKYKHKGKPAFKSCGKVAGLVVRCFDTGAKVFYYRKRHKGKLVVVRMGNYPDMSLVEAAQFSGVLGLLVTKGYSSKDLTAAVLMSDAPDDLIKHLDGDFHEVAVTTGGATFGEVHMQWFESDGKKRKHINQINQHKNMPRNHLQPIYNRPISDLKTSDYIRAMKTVWLETPETAKKLSFIILEVCGKHKADNDFYQMPFETVKFFVKQLRSKHGKPNKKRKKQAHIRHTKAPEFYREFAASRDMKALSNLAAIAVMFTGKRVEEVVALRWNQLDDGIWYQEIDDGKTPDIYDIAITDLLAEVIEMAREAGRGLPTSNFYVFPSDKCSSGHITQAAVLQQMQKTSFGKLQSNHGWRHVIKSWGRSAGKNKLEVEYALCHKEAGIAGDYGDYPIHHRTREIMNDWEKFLTGGQL